MTLPECPARTCRPDSRRPCKGCRIATMLSGLEDARETLRGPSGVRGTGELIPQMPDSWNRSYRELERCLVVLREDAPKLHWHLCERYLRRDEVTLELPAHKGRIKLPAHHELVAGQPTVGAKTVRVRCRRWAPMVRAEKVRRALALLVSEFEGEPFAPSSERAA